MAISGTIERLVMECTNPIEMNLWKAGEATYTCLKSELLPSEIRMARVLRTALKMTTNKTENDMYPFNFNESGYALSGDGHNDVGAQFICLDCGRRLYLFAKMCTTCLLSAKTFCMNQSKRACQTCDKPHHLGSSFHRFEETNMQSVLPSLKGIAKKKFHLEHHKS